MYICIVHIALHVHVPSTCAEHNDNIMHTVTMLNMHECILHSPTHPYVHVVHTHTYIHVHNMCTCTHVYHTYMAYILPRRYMYHVHYRLPLVQCIAYMYRYNIVNFIKNISFDLTLCISYIHYIHVSTHDMHII